MIRSHITLINYKAMKKNREWIFFRNFLCLKSARSWVTLAAGAPPKYAAIIGNIAASIVIRSFGCATTSIEQIQASLNKMNMENYTIKV